MQLFPVKRSTLFQAMIILLHMQRIIVPVKVKWNDVIINIVQKIIVKEYLGLHPKETPHSVETGEGDLHGPCDSSLVHTSEPNLPISRPARKLLASIFDNGQLNNLSGNVDVAPFHQCRRFLPFWRLWNAAGSGGRGVIGVLEANFVEPAHDKQGFERTTVLARLETKLIQMQKNYWKTHCHKIGYASCRNKNLLNGSTERESSPDYDPRRPSKYSKHVASGAKPAIRISEKFASMESRRFHVGDRSTTKAPSRSGESLSSSEPSSPLAMDMTEHGTRISRPKKTINDSNGTTPVSQKSYNKGNMHVSSPVVNLDADDSEQVHASAERVCGSQTGSKVGDIELLREENRELKERLAKSDSDMVAELNRELKAERERCQMLENQLQETREKIEQLNKEQETLIDIFSEERERREAEEKNLRKKLKDASTAMDDLLNKVRLLENAKSLNKSDA